MEYYNYKKPHNSPEMPTILSPSDHIETGDKKENKKIHKEEDRLFSEDFVNKHKK